MNVGNPYFCMAEGRTSVGHPYTLDHRLNDYLDTLNLSIRIIRKPAWWGDSRAKGKA